MESEKLNRQTHAKAPPRIYVASLSDYNVGYLHGRWIDADQSLESIQEQIVEMLAESSQPIAEEWAIHDYENFGSLRLSEFEDLQRVAEVARLMAEHGGLAAEVVGHCGGTSNIDEARRYMEEAYRGAFDSLRDYASELVEDCYSDALKALPDFIRYNIDYESIGRDMELGGDVFTISHDGQLHIFDANI